MSKEILWDAPLRNLFQRHTKTLDAYEQAGIHLIRDLLDIIPLRIEILPPPAPFQNIEENEPFQGVGKIINIQKKMNFFRKGKGRSPLYNVTVYLSDYFNQQDICQLHFFNCYPSVAKKLESCQQIQFQGKAQQYKGAIKIINPTFDHFVAEQLNSDVPKISVIYPTINGVKPSYTQQLFEKIPRTLWNNIEDTLPQSFLKERQLISLQQCYQMLHGVVPVTMDEFEKAKERLIYNDFFLEQIKIFVRRQLIETISVSPLEINDMTLQSFRQLFPYQLTSDQEKCLATIRNDLKQGYPMMKLIQGDVGSGKTTVAILSALISIQNEKQVALMCPTESLAMQHYQTISHLLKPLPIQVDLLIGGQKEKDKKIKRENIATGKTQFIIGTHSLIQESVSFKNLSMAIIDEQHKFGVNQRIKLTKKGKGVHTLIMTATPIPRSLSLTQYGDLDISIIKTMPLHRKGIQTRIVTPINFDKYLTFLNTRLSLGEQAYIVTPAIFEQEDSNFVTLEKAFERFTCFFPDKKISMLHGKLSTEEKAAILDEFSKKQSDILLSTSVIEVGIDVPNATVMTIMSPERFGLSSLHQLRGRVGRGNKPGFCFLVSEKDIAKESLERLEVIEKTCDGFEISEQDLKFRGEGNLFGTDQSGEGERRLGNIITHGDLLEKAREDLFKLLSEENNFILEKISQLMKDEHIIKTI